MNDFPRFLTACCAIGIFMAAVWSGNYFGGVLFFFMFMFLLLVGVLSMPHNHEVIKESRTDWQIRELKMDNWKQLEGNEIVAAKLGWEYRKRARWFGVAIFIFFVFLYCLT